MSKQHFQDDRAGSSDHEQHRAPEGQGNAAPTTDGHIENSIFDSKGNEVIVVTTTDDDGNVAQGTGRTTEEALADAKKGGDRVGKGFESH